MAESFRINSRIYRKTLVLFQELVPLKFEQFIVIFGFVKCLEFQNWNDDFQRCSAGIIKFIEKTKVALAGYRTVFGFYVFAA